MEQSDKDYEIAKTVCSHLLDKEWTREQRKAGKSIQEILGFNSAVLNRFYKGAYALFQERSYGDASDAFLFLVTVNPEQYDYWIGLGSSIQRCGNYEAAIDAYEMAAVCQIDCPVPYFHLAKCLFAMHDRKNALQALELVIEYSEGHSEYDDLRYQALAARRLLLENPQE